MESEISITLLIPLPPLLSISFEALIAQEQFINSSM